MDSATNNSKVSDEQAMHEMMSLLDDWKAPEPTAWFDARMMARFRAEQAREPEGFFARLRDRWLFNSNPAMKPLMAGSLAIAMVALGGGSYLQLAHLTAPQQPAAVSATVQDLQILDNNAQAIQQMDQLLSDDNDTAPPQS